MSSNPSPGSKRKSQKRFEQLNRIVDEVGPTLRTPAHLAVLFVCFRHAGPQGRFAVSNARIARSCSLSARQVVRIMDDLESVGVVKLLSEHQGPIPKRYRITGEVAG